MGGKYLYCTLFWSYEPRVGRQDSNQDNSTKRRGKTFLQFNDLQMSHAWHVLCYGMHNYPVYNRVSTSRQKDGRSLIYEENRSGPHIDPCCTPVYESRVGESWLLTIACLCLLIRYNSIQLSAHGERFLDLCNVFGTINQTLWLIALKGFKKKSQQNIFISTVHIELSDEKNYLKQNKAKSIKMLWPIFHFSQNTQLTMPISV